MFDFGILWMNAHNLSYIKKYNSKKGMALADNKLKTKKLLSTLWIPTSETYTVIKNIEELKVFSFDSVKNKRFVIKPNKGSQWKGIWLVEKKESEYLVDGTLYSEEVLRTHMHDILDGAFSISGFYDQVIIEEILTPHHDFMEFCRFGLADICIIVFNSVPVAAMIRVPTKVSGGKANLAQGGIGFWIHISTGQLNSFLLNGKIFSENFPLPYDDLEGKKIPHWDSILTHSSKLQSEVDLGYLALDWVISKSGPKLLEINARAGLEIQNITWIPLKSRLQRIKNIKIDSYKKGISIAHSLFWGNFQTVVDTSNTLYLSQFWTLKIQGKKENTSLPVNITMDLTSQTTKISKNIAEDIKKSSFSISIDGTSIRFQDFEYGIIENSLSKNEISLGIKEARNYIIKPIHRYQTIEKYFEGAEYVKIREIDKEINGCWRWLNLSFILKPLNLEEEKKYFIEKESDYNPTFVYAFPDDDTIASIRERLLEAKSNLDTLNNSHKIYHLFEEKLDELFTKLWLLIAYKNQDFERIDSYQKKLYGEFDTELFELAKKKINERDSKQKQSGILWKPLSFEETISKLQEWLITYWLPEMPIVVDPKNTARISIISWKDASIHLQENAVFYEKEIDSIIAHEIGVHLRRFINGTKSWLRILKHGTGYYLEDEEWLAIYNSLRYLPEWYEKNEMYLKYYLVTIASSHSFSELALRLKNYYPDDSLESIFNRCVRLKKWLMDTSVDATVGTVYEKDKIYLQGYIKIKKWIEQGGYIENMLVWKIKTQDIDRLSSF
jgi:alpha-L-glutamate ligase-like protein